MLLPTKVPNKKEEKEIPKKESLEQLISLGDSSEQHEWHSLDEK